MKIEYSRFMNLKHSLESVLKSSFKSSLKSEINNVSRKFRSFSFLCSLLTVLTMTLMSSLMAAGLFFSVASAASWLEVDNGLYVDVDSVDVDIESVGFIDEKTGRFIAEKPARGNVCALTFKDDNPDYSDKNITHSDYYTLVDFNNKVVALKAILGYDSKGDIVDYSIVKDNELFWMEAKPGTIGGNMYEAAEIVASAALGKAEDQMILAHNFLLQGDKENYIKWLKKAAENGYPEAQQLLEKIN